MASIKKIEGKRGTSYKITVCDGADKYGRKKRHYMTYKPPKGATAHEVRRELQKVVAEFENAFVDEEYEPDSKITFAEYAEYVYSLHVQRGDRPNSLAQFRRCLKRVNAFIGNMRLTKIRPKHLQYFYEILQEPGARKWNIFAVPAVDNIAELIGNRFHFSNDSGIDYGVVCRAAAGEPIMEKSAKKISEYLGRDDLFRLTNTGKPVSPATIRIYHGAIYSVLDRAYREMIIRVNPAERVILPKNKRVRESRTLTTEEIRQLLDALEDAPLQFRTLITFLLCTGCRRGEACALTWDKVDLDGRTITIDAGAVYTVETGCIVTGTKTGNSRTVTIPPELVALLKKHRAKQAERRLMMGDMWEDGNFVFTTIPGKMYRPDMVTNELSRFCKSHGLPHYSPHMFRHTAASLLIANGVDVVTVANALGHSNVKTTLDTYAHAIEEAQTKTAETMSAVLFAAK